MTDERDAQATKAELLDRIRTSYAAWQAAAEAIPESAMIRPVLPGDWSAKDLVAHVAAYEQWTAAQVRAATEGREPTPLELYGQDDVAEDPQGWDLDRQNAAIHARYRDVPLLDVLAFAERAHHDLVAALEAVPDDDVARPGAQPWTNGKSLLEVVPGQSWRHIEEHIDDLRALAGKGVV